MPWADRTLSGRIIDSLRLLRSLCPPSRRTPSAQHPPSTDVCLFGTTFYHQNYSLVLYTSTYGNGNLFWFVPFWSVYRSYLTSLTGHIIPSDCFYLSPQKSLNWKRPHCTYATSWIQWCIQFGCFYLWAGIDAPSTSKHENCFVKRKIPAKQHKKWSLLNVSTKVFVTTLINGCMEWV